MKTLAFDVTIAKKMHIVQGMLTNNAQLKREPFGVDPNPLSYFHSHSGKSLYRQLAYRIRKKPNNLLLLGESGVGKTALLHDAITRLASDTNFVIRQPESDSIHKLIKDLCNGLELQTKNDNSLSHTLSLTNYLSGKKPARIVFVIEDADQLLDAVLEKLFLFSISLSDEESVLQILLVGLPELELRINQLKLPASKQYKTYCHRLENLSRSEVEDYILFRLNAAEYGNTGEIFTAKAISRIADYSDGKPSLINKICGLALIMAETEGSEVISCELVDNVANLLLFKPIDEAKKPSQLEPPLPELAQQLNDTHPSQHEITETLADPNEDKVRHPLGKGLFRREPQSITWGLTALFMAFISFLAYQVNTTPSLPSTVASIQREKTLADDKTSLSAAFFAKLGIGSADKIKDDPIDKTMPSRARELIVELDSYDQPVDLDEVYRKAEYWTEQNQLADAYLLYFYAARHGNGNSAFKLAQLYDPATFKTGSGMTDSPSLMQANKWYKHAVRAGHPEAKRLLDRIRLQAENRAALGNEKARNLILQFHQT